jgi:hypothetical protein
MYRVEMTVDLVQVLEWMINEGGGWIDMQRELPRRMLEKRTYNRLGFWRLIQRRETGTELLRAGLWRVTDLGLRFWRGLVSMPQYLDIEDGAVVGEGPALVHVSHFGEGYV